MDISHLEIRNHINIANWNKEDYIDINGHGTHIAGIILDHVCDEVELISCKFYSPANDFPTSEEYQKSLRKGLECFKQATKLKVDLVNYSAGGQQRSDDEYNVIRDITKTGIKVIVAAGNNGYDLGREENGYYPAKYNLKNLIVVGNLEKNFRRNITSNYGLKGMVWEVGTKVLSTAPKNSIGYMTGTSQATAVHTNKLLREMCARFNHE